MLENDLAIKVALVVVTCIVAIILQATSSRIIKRLFEKGNAPRGSIVNNIVRAFIWFMALLAVLKPVFGVEPTAFVAALGVTSVALSLGLQNTISNVIGGLELMLAHIIEVGDWIEVGSYRGVVTDITWRSTTIRTTLNDIIVIPNSVLDGTMLRKLSPTSSHTITVPLDIHPEADMAEVERDIRAAVTEAVAPWRDPDQPIRLIEQGYGSFGFRLDIRVPLIDIENPFEARSAIVQACSGRSWLARW
jgi:small-conductance mechanosensitive channel